MSLRFFDVAVVVVGVVVAAGVLVGGVGGGRLDLDDLGLTGKPNLQSREQESGALEVDPHAR
jgi:hypothetical protein